MYLVYDRWSQGTVQYRMYPGGISVVGVYSGESKSEVIQKVLSDCNEAYDIIDKEDGSWQECASERIVWEPGDPDAGFGDFDVLAIELEDIETGSHIHRAAIRAHIMDESGEVLIF